MLRIPLPRRGLRSILGFSLLLLASFLTLRHLRTIYPILDSSLPDPLANAGSSSGSSWLRRPQAVLPQPGSGLQEPAIPNKRPPRDISPADRPLVIQDSSRNTVPETSLTEPHRFLPNGLLEVNPSGQHPIYDLIGRGKRAWRDKESRASRTLSQAVDEYRRRYGRSPPKGFDRWWKWAKDRRIKLPDEYDQIHADLEPFYALTPKEIQALIRDVQTRSGMYTVTCPDHSALTGKGRRRCSYEIIEKGLNEEGRRVAKERAKEQLGLLEEIEEELEAVEAVFYSHDVPWQFVGHEYKSALEDAAGANEYYNTEEHELDWKHLGWASACAPHKPLRQDYDVETLPDLDGLWQQGKKSFIWDHKAAMDPCIHPTMTHLVGFLSGHGKGPGPSKELYPVMAMCKTTLHSDVLAVSMEAWTEDVGEDPEWEAKRDDRMLWRGKNTGIYFKEGVPWNISQRINLVKQTAQIEGTLPVLPVLQRLESIGKPLPVPLERLNNDLMDVAFVDEAIQCDPEECAQVSREYRFAGRKDWNAGNQYKYLLDIDGNGWSARFKRLMSTNSVVLKSTIFPEWYTDRIQPWVHYIPIKADLTDLYDVLTFFREGHDAMAKEIAMVGKKWSKEYWRREDMVSYQFRLFLELARLAAPNRAAASYRVKGSDIDE